MIKELEIDGEVFRFDSTVDQILRRGLIDPYMRTRAKNLWVVLFPYIFWSARYQCAICIPRWFLSDLASIPRPVRLLIPVNGRHRLNAVAHDLLYFLQPEGITRHMADVMYLDFNKMSGVSFTNRRSQHAGLCVGGWVGWRNNKGHGSVSEADRIWYQKEYPQLGLPIEDSFSGIVV